MLAELTLLITGLPSPGKARLVDALQGRLRPANISVRSRREAPELLAIPILHVHAETDLEAFVEGGLRDSDSAKGAQVVVPVDWEPVDRSVTRIIDSLSANGVATERAGA